MKSKIKILKLTPDHRMWRIDWLGELHFPHGHGNTQPSILVSISPLQCDVNDNDAMLAFTATKHNQQRRVSIKLGLLPIIRVGDVWQNGYCVSAPKYQLEQFNKLKISNTSIRLIKAGYSVEDAFILPLDEHPWHSKDTKSFCVCITLPDERQIVIPCLELIRFYFGSSSKFLHLLFTKKIEHSDFWKNFHFNDNTKRLYLKLAEELIGTSAQDIGRIARDSNAWKSARLIYSSCMVSTLAKERIYPYTYFPFEGETNLVCNGKWLSGGTKPNATFLVYRLNSCAHPFPFNELSYELSNNQKITKKNSQSESQNTKTNTVVADNRANNSSYDVTNKDPSKTKTTTNTIAEDLPRFPDLTNKRIWCERYDTQDPPAVIRVNGMVAEEEYGVGQSSYEKDNQGVRGVDIGLVNNRMIISEIDPKRYKFVLDGIEVAIRQLKLKSNRLVTELITLPGYTHPVISLPYLVDEDGVIDPISLCKGRGGKDRVRRGCFIEILEDSNVSHKVFIVERKEFNDFVSAVNISAFELKHAMEALLKYSVKRNVKSKQVKSELNDAQVWLIGFFEGISKQLKKLTKVS